MVNTPADARAVVRDARFLPLGERSRGGVRSALAFGTDPVTYFAQGNEQTIVMVQIETAEAVVNAAAIAAVEGIDCLFVGPSDLASTYGQTYPQAWESLSGPYGEAIRSIPEIARLHGKAAGILAYSAAMGRECAGMGYTVVGISVDTSLLAAAARHDCALFHQQN
jgi:4-hydroxy-2-oxoheptanedioate aldolase